MPYRRKKLTFAISSPDEFLCTQVTVIYIKSQHTEGESETLKAIQRRALRIIYPLTTGMPYTFALTLPKLPSLRDRREHINRQFFRSIFSSCISSLLPIPRNHDVTSRLRAASLYPRPVTRTKRYTSFINYSLLHYQ